jgi:hypothetical protein
MAARQAERERRPLGREFRRIMHALNDAYPWTVNEDGFVVDDMPEGITPALHAKAQALVAAILPEEAVYEDTEMQVARLVFAALDAAWRARMATAGAGE